MRIEGVLKGLFTGSALSRGGSWRGCWGQISASAKASLFPAVDKRKESRRPGQEKLLERAIMWARWTKLFIKWFLMLPKCYASIYQEANRKQDNFFCVCVSVICKAAVTKGCETSWDSVSRSCRGVLFQSLWEGEEILWILPVWAQGSQSEQGGLVWELLLIYETHTHTLYRIHCA